MRWKLSNHKDTGSLSGSANTTERYVPSGWPSRACCCPAAPMVKIVMPASADRPRPVDLYLCGHHYRASRRSLQAAEATVCDAQGRTDPLPLLDLAAV